MEVQQAAQQSSPQQFGKFELLEEIGQGGMATVHRAVLRGLGGFEREMVIKRILPDLARDEHFLKMFIDEAKLSALLEHPNIVQIYDFGSVDGRYFIAMEFIEGVTLLRFNRAHGKKNPVEPAAAAFVVQQVCAGLQYAHQLSRGGQRLGLVHRDISPANVMITAHGGVKLLDFGIAKAVEAIEREDTRTGTLKGKWSYMSPEQVEGRPVTAQSDIFATGIILWEMLTGRRLFKAKTDYLTLTNVVKARVPPVTEFRPEVPAVFNEICGRALARRPEDRYQNAEQMSEALESFLHFRPYAPTQLAQLVRPLRQQSRSRTSGPDGSPSASGSESSSAVGFRVSAEPSGSRSQSMSASVTAMPAGEQAELEPPKRSLVMPLVIAGLVLATLVVVTLYALLKPPSGRAVAAGIGSGSVPAEGIPGAKRSATKPGSTSGAENNGSGAESNAGSGAGTGSSASGSGSGSGATAKAPTPLDAPPNNKAPIKKAPAKEAPAKKAPPENARGRKQPAVRAKTPPSRNPPSKGAPSNGAGGQLDTPAKVRIVITSTPAGAAVRVGGRLIGRTPLKLMLPRGTRARLRIDLAKHKTLWRALRVDRARKLHYKLARDVPDLKGGALADPYADDK